MPMQAIVHDVYGPPEVLRLDEVERPTPAADELLVRVHAATVNRTDCGFRSGRPLFVRFVSGVRRPKHRVLGTEYAGVVEAVGPAVTRFSVGDRVLGVHANRFGTHAEFVAVREGSPIAPMPASGGFAEAAAAGDGAILALANLRRGGVRPGQRLMIYGASGAIGTAAVQLAKHFGAEVTAVCGTANVELVRSLGADRVIDYQLEDFTAIGDRFEVVFDAVGKSSFRRCRKLLERRGMYLSTDLGYLFHVPPLALATRITGRFGSRRVSLPVPSYTAADLDLLRGLIDAGEYRAVIDRSYPLDQVLDATRYVEAGQKVGNVVVTVVPDVV